MTIDVLSLGSFPPATNDELARRFAITHRVHQPAPQELSDELRGRIRAIATEANRGASRALIEALPKLEIIGLFGVGTDAVDLAAARERRIPVTNTPGILTDECADLAIGLMLASARQILFADGYVRDGSWAAKGPIPLGRSVGGKTMGVVGLGGIGRGIADRGAAFRMRVIYHGPRRKPDAPYEYVADLVEMARQSDYLMVACKGGPETQGLVSAAVIDALGPQGDADQRGAWLGGRRTGADQGAGERPARSCGARRVRQRADVAPALLTLPNVIVQPHQGSATIETRTAIGQLMIDNISAHFAGRPLLTPVL